MSEEPLLPISLVNIPFNIKTVHGGHRCSFALTEEGQVFKWGDGKPFKIIEDLNNIVFLCFHDGCFIPFDEKGDVFWLYSLVKDSLNYELKREEEQHYANTTKIGVTKHFLPNQPCRCSFLFDGNIVYVLDIDGNVWKYDDFLNTKPVKVQGLDSVAFLTGNYGIFAAIDNNGKVFVWGKLSKLSDVYEDHHEPRLVETFISVEDVSIGDTFLFAYNKTTVWAWGRNDRGQLGTGDLIDRPQPVKVFGSEILGSINHPNQPLDRMFSGLIKLIYFEYLQYLKNLFGNHPYTKARYCTKCSISKKVAKFSKEVINGFEFLEDPQDLDLNDYICDLQLQLSTVHNGPKVINTRIIKLDVNHNDAHYDPQLLSFFPNVEVVVLGGWSSFGRSSINLANLSKLKCLELNYPFNIEQLPTSLVQLVLNHDEIKVTDLSYLTLIRELAVLSLDEDYDQVNILKGYTHLPQSIVRLEMELELGDTVSIEVQLPNLNELIIHKAIPANVTEQNFPALKFIQLIEPDEDSLSDSPLSPTNLINQGFINSVELIKNEYLVELSCFPWWIQYSAERYLIEIFRDYVD
ncbi:hypothetical protein P9112_001828 [Eukaryota sp. TZLM1-RC]